MATVPASVVADGLDGVVVAGGAVVADGAVAGDESGAAVEEIAGVGVVTTPVVVAIQPLSEMSCLYQLAESFATRGLAGSSKSTW